MKERKISRRAVCSAMVASLALGVLEGCGSSSSTTSSAAGSGAAASNERITVRILKSKAANEVAAEQMDVWKVLGEKFNMDFEFDNPPQDNYNERLNLVMMDAQSKVKRLMDEAFEQQHLSMNVVLNYTQILCMVSLVKSCRYVGIISEAAGHSIPGCEGLVLRSFEEPLVFDLGFFFKTGRYLPKLGWELIRFLQASEKPYLKYWEEKHASGRRQ